MICPTNGVQTTKHQTHCEEKDAADWSCKAPLRVRGGLLCCWSELIAAKLNDGRRDGREVGQKPIFCHVTTMGQCKGRTLTDTIWSYR
jgi:hypothetical protein